MTLQDMLVPTYVQMLGALSAWLGKAAEARPIGGEQALLTARLAPDMFPLSTQVRFACVQAQEGVFRLRQQAFPPSLEVLLDEGRNAAERPGSIADARARIAETIGIVDVATAEPAEVDPAAPIAHTLPQGMVFDLTAEQYVRDWALPQFYFHVMTAYAILRRRASSWARLTMSRTCSRIFAPALLPRSRRRAELVPPTGPRTLRALSRRCSRC